MEKTILSLSAPLPAPDTAGADFLPLSANNHFKAGYFPILVKFIFACLVFTFFNTRFISTLSAQTTAPPAIEWDKTIGGNNYDWFPVIKPTTDGGYIIGSTSTSDVSGDKSEPHQASPDFWLVKIDANGNKVWDKTYGGTNEERLESVHQTTDGGYILGGVTRSYITNEDDYYVIKVNAAGGKEWEKVYGGIYSDILSTVKQTPDGGYIVGGGSFSPRSRDKSENSKGVLDMWIIKLDASGNKLWDKTIGGNGTDGLASIHVLPGGGYILGGSSSSSISGDKSENDKGRDDYWVVKLSPSGVKEWDKTIGGGSEDYLISFEIAGDMGYLLGGFSYSNASGDKSENNRGEQDYWVVKLNAAGTKEWDRTLGGSSVDLFFDLKPTLDGGSIVGGYSYSNMNSDKSENEKGGGDYWVVKLDGFGNKVWDKTIGTTVSDYLESLTQSADGGYVLAGYTHAGISGDKTQPAKGEYDLWIVKLRGETNAICNLALTTKITQAEPWYGMWGPFNGAGSIDLTVSGGTAPYTYRWNSGTATQDIPAASPGMYSVTVTDAKGCTASTTVYVGRKNTPLTLASSHINISGVGRQDGSIDLSVIGGVVPATFRWSNGATTEDLTNLAPGTYTVVVTDAFGRTATTSVTVSAPGTALSLMEAHKDVSKAGADDGFIDLTVVGGKGPYTYRWNNGATTQDLTRVTAGLYQVMVTDGLGASATLSIEINTPGTLTSAKSPALTEAFTQKETNFRVYPNPATDKVSISFSLAAPGNYTLELYDLRGAKVKTVATGRIQASKDQTLHINLSGYAEGVYLLKLQTANGIATKRISVLR